jgi:2-keto-3-deoxy-L-rhamnonate aldolase RhmA
MSGTEVVPLVRLGGYQQGTVNQILDTGPRGVVVPMINSRMETEGAVSAVLYPPSGTRGIGLGRAHSYDPGTRNEYLGSANATMLIVIQIEHQSAVARIEEIVSVQGIDVVFLGLVDLAGSLGHPGHTSHPDVARAVEKVVSVTREAGLTLGIAVNGKEELAARIKQGFRFFHLGADIAYLAQASKQRVREARAILDSPLIPQLTGQ